MIVFSPNCRPTIATLALALVALAPAGTAVAADIYKCVDPAGKVTYQSAPCKGGAKLELDAGNYDPAAAEQLRTEHREFEARDSERRLAAERDEARRLDRQAAERMAAQDQARNTAAANEACSDCSWGSVLPLPIDAWRPRPPRPVAPLPPRPPDPGTMPGIPRAKAGALPPLVAPAPPLGALRGGG